MDPLLEKWKWDLNWYLYSERRLEKIHMAR